MATHSDLSRSGATRYSLDTGVVGHTLDIVSPLDVVPAWWVIKHYPLGCASGVDWLVISRIIRLWHTQTHQHMPWCMPTTQHKAEAPLLLTLLFKAHSHTCIHQANCLTLQGSSECHTLIRLDTVTRLLIGLAVWSSSPPRPLWFQQARGFIYTLHNMVFWNG